MTGRRSLVPAWAIAAILAIPLAAVAVFWQLQRGPAAPAHERAQGKGDDGVDLTDAEMQRMAERLAVRLAREPDDADGWRTLGRTYYVMKRFPQAVAAYERLVALGEPLDAGVLADFADALAMAQGQRLGGRPMELVRQALELDPRQWKALSMAATEAFQRDDFAAAITYWERARASLAPDSPMAASIDASLAQARARQAERGTR